MKSVLDDLINDYSANKFFDLISEDNSSNSSQDEDENEKDNSNIINSFAGKYSFLSNEFIAHQKSGIYYEDEDSSGNTYLNHTFEIFETVEHAFQCSKTTDRKSQIEIRDAETARTAARLGSRVDLVDHWDDKKIDVMQRLLEDKFSQNFELKIRLLLTKDSEIIYTSKKDNYWGVNSEGVGENNLGKLLMKIRNKIKRDEGTFMQLIRSYLDKQGIGFILDWVDENKVSL